jgi:hypothetical protein
MSAMELFYPQTARISHIKYTPAAEIKKPAQPRAFESGALGGRNLMFLAFLGDGADRRDLLGKFPADFVFENLAQGDVRQPEGADVVNQRATQAAAAGVQLAHTARYQVYEYVRVPDFFHSPFAKFSVHYFFRKLAGQNSVCVKRMQS